MPCWQGLAEQGKQLALCSALGCSHLDIVSSLGLPLYSVTPPSAGMLVGAPRLVRAGGRGPGRSHGELGPLSVLSRWLGVYLITRYSSVKGSKEDYVVKCFWLLWQMT